MSASKPLSTERLSNAPGRAGPLKLLVVSGPDFGAELLLDAGAYAVGKQAPCDLVLSDPAVSRTHLRIERTPGGAKFSDEASTNGSFFEGNRFSAIELGPGAVVRIGNTDLQLVPASSAAPAFPAATRESFGRLVGRSLRMRQVFALLERISPTASAVLVTGPTGSGKELCASAIHAESPRAKGPFVVCDLGGTAPPLIESELFGHVRGAFTDARSDRAGAFERADGGTLFLDEVGELPLEIQPRLLRALEARQVKRVGSNDYQTVDVRVVAATNRDLAAEVRAGRFREDLFHRLAVVEVALPALGERREDIPLLVDRMLEERGHSPLHVSEATRALLTRYEWPGNVRELRNAVERVVALGGEALPLGRGAAPPAPTEASAAELPFKEAKERILQAFERDYLEDLMQRHSGNLSQASRAAGIARLHLRNLLQKHALYSNPKGRS